MGMFMGERTVKAKVKQFAKEIWGLDCNLPVTFSARMTRALGYYHFRQSRYDRMSGMLATPIKFQFSKHLINGNYSEETIDSVIKHELCHWKISLETIHFGDGDRAFENEIRRIGSHSTGVIQTSGTIYTCVCSCCGKIVVKKRTAKQAIKYATPKYSSKCCHAPLKYAGVKEIEDTNVTPIALDEKLRKTACNSSTTISSILKIEDIIKPENNRKINNKQMIPAIKSAIQEKSHEKMQLLKKTYPDVFESSLKYIPEKLKTQMAREGL